MSTPKISAFLKQWTILFKGCPVAVPMSRTFLMVFFEASALSPIVRYVALGYKWLILCEEFRIDIAVDQGWDVADNFG